MLFFLHSQRGKAAFLCGGAEQALVRVKTKENRVLSVKSWVCHEYGFYIQCHSTLGQACREKLQKPLQRTVNALKNQT